MTAFRIYRGYKVSQYEMYTVVPAIRKAYLRKGIVIERLEALDILVDKQEELSEGHFMNWKRDIVKDSDNPIFINL